MRDVSIAETTSSMTPGKAPGSNIAAVLSMEHNLFTGATTSQATSKTSSFCASSAPCLPESSFQRCFRKEPAQLARAPAAAAFKPSQTGLLYRWDLPPELHPAADCRCPRCILLCKLQLRSFRSAPETLLNPCEVYAAHVGTHVQQGKTQPSSFYVTSQRRVLLSNAALENKEHECH